MSKNRIGASATRPGTKRSTREGRERIAVPGAAAAAMLKPSTTPAATTYMSGSVALTL
jgi:hypothetical protein